MGELINQAGVFSPEHRHTSKSLYKAIFASEMPEQVVQELPAQSLHLIIKQAGLQSCVELVEILPIEKMRLCLDLDLWNHDEFNEENFWEWLSLSDDEDPIKFNQKILRSIDLKLIGYLISKYVTIQLLDEPADQPPGPQFYTPDNGYTWLNIGLEDGTKHFLFTRFLALLFETDTKIFYQLISVPGVSTLTQLEEESFAERNKRLAAEGIPELDFTIELNAPLMPYEAKALIAENKQHPIVNDIPAIQPIIHDNFAVFQPLTALFLEIKDLETAEAELSLIINASLGFFRVPFYEYEAVLAHVEKVKGAINIGLEKALQLGAKSALHAYEVLAFQKLYRLGLFELFELRSNALKIPEDELKLLIEDKKLFSIIAHARERFPVSVDFSYDPPESKTLSHLSDIAALKEVLPSKKQLGSL